jgi:hypothetical protein
MPSPNTTLLVVSGMATSALIYYSYRRITDEIDRGSSLVIQSLHNMNAHESLKNVTGGKCTVLSRIRGEMLQRKGVANVSLDVQCRQGEFTVQIFAHREGFNWRTDQLTLFQNGQECCMLNEI